MTVIINEFEIDVAQPEQETTDNEQPPQQPEAPSKPTPLDLRDVQDWYERRQSRVWAH